MLFAAPSAAAIASPPQERAVLKMIRMSGDDERMAGSIPVWEKATAADLNRIEPGAGADGPRDFSDVLAAYAPQPDTAPTASPDQEFGFGDLIDMVNPLQHIPVVSHLYRKFTGDEINPASRVIGDTLFGGPMGGAISLANVAIEDGTGRDITDNLVGALTGERSAPAKPAGDSPEKRLTAAVQAAINEADAPAAADTLPGTVLGFADLGSGKRMVEAGQAAVSPASYGAAYWHLNE